MWWDTLIAIAIIGAILLVAWSKITKKTLPEVINSITEVIRERKESAMDIN